MKFRTAKDRKEKNDFQNPAKKWINFFHLRDFFGFLDDEREFLHVLLLLHRMKHDDERKV